MNPRCRVAVEPLETHSERQRYYRELYLAASSLPIVEVEDHSQMVSDADRVEREKYFAENDWVLFDARWICERLTSAANAAYENDVAHVVAKLLMRQQ